MGAVRTRLTRADGQAGPGPIGAVVLAAGKSSRMGASKPLLPVGHVPALERLIGALTRAGVGDIVVVSGHDSGKIAPLIDRLAVRAAHNAEYERGMFSSVRTGVEALRAGIEAFFVLPVDHPLVGAKVLERLIACLGPGEAGIVHPTCCGLRGHPPLISSRYRDPLLAAGDDADLGGLLRRHAHDAAEVEVEDATILMDMDTREDYERVVRFAALLDGVAASDGVAAPDGTTVPPALSDEDVLYLLGLLAVPEKVVRHCRTVAMVGTALAEALTPRVPRLDAALVRSACLLHDLVRTKPKHAAVAQRLLENLGLCRLGEVVGAHMVMPAGLLESPAITEEELVYLADKLVVEDEIAGLEARTARAESRSGSDPAAKEWIDRRIRTAGTIRERVESVLGRPLDEVLPRQTRASI